jgi:hypothetical protein
MHFRFPLPPRIFGLVMKNIELGTKLKASLCNGVHVGETIVSVDADDGSLCCGYSCIYGIPCMHMCRLANSVSIEPSQLVRQELTTQHNLNIFEAALPILPMTTVDIPTELLLPPVSKAQRGRPATKRLHSSIDKNIPDEAKKREARCGKCSQVGHNRRSCTANVE